MKPLGIRYALKRMAHTGPTVNNATAEESLVSFTDSGLAGEFDRSRRSTKLAA